MRGGEREGQKEGTTARGSGAGSRRERRRHAQLERLAEGELVGLLVQRAHARLVLLLVVFGLAELDCGGGAGRREGGEGAGSSSGRAGRRSARSGGETARKGRWARARARRRTLDARLLGVLIAGGHDGLDDCEGGVGLGGGAWSGMRGQMAAARDAPREARAAGPSRRGGLEARGSRRSRRGRATGGWRRAHP